MNVVSFPAKMPRPSSDGLRRLNEIADVLGVSVDTFSATAQLHVLHTGEDGERWLLELDGQGTPTIRFDSPAAEQGTPGESIQAFLIRDLGSLQHRALAALINHLLTEHLLFDAG